MHNNIDRNKQIRKYYLHIVIFADFMPFRVHNTLLSYFVMAIPSEICPWTH